MAFDPLNPFPDFNRPLIQQEKARNAMPVRPPDGESATSGAWTLMGNTWMWRRNDGSYAANGAAQKPGQGTNPSGTVPTDMAAYNQGRENDKVAAEARKNANPFGNEMMNYQQQYTPFGLQSAFGTPGGGGGGGAPYSYLSDQLVPSLEQRRMGMMTQMFNPGGR